MHADVGQVLLEIHVVTAVRMAVGVAPPSVSSSVSSIMSDSRYLPSSSSLISYSLLVSHLLAPVHALMGQSAPVTLISPVITEGKSVGSAGAEGISVQGLLTDIFQIGWVK